VGLLFISGCVEDSGDVIVTKRESQTYFLTLQSNLTESVGDGVTYLYLDVPGSENRTFYDFIGDDNR
jgi:hypothetical protein